MCVIYVGCELSFLIADAMLRRITSNNNVTPSAGGGNNMVMVELWLAIPAAIGYVVWGEGFVRCMQRSVYVLRSFWWLWICGDRSASVKQVSFWNYNIRGTNIIIPPCIY